MINHSIVTAGTDLDSFYEALVCGTVVLVEAKNG